MEIDFTLAIGRINEMLNGLIASLPNFGVAVIVFILFFLAAKVFQVVVRGISERSGLGISAGIVFGRLSQWAIVLGGLLVSSSIVFPSMQAVDIFGILGIGSIAIGFAFRDIAQNFLAGILLLLTQPFRIGDQIIVSGFEGTVEDIQTRATYINTYDGRRVVIPNTDLFVQSVIVNTAKPTRRSQYDFGIGYGVDLDYTRRLILQAISRVKDVLQDPAPDVLIVDLAESTVNLRARWWTLSARREVITIQDQVIDAIKKELDAHDVDMPYPTQTVLLRNQNGSIAEK